MKLGLSLFVIFALGKLYTAVVHRLDLGALGWITLIGQDAICAIVVAIISRFSTRAGWVVYTAAVLHFAVSMPLLRIMATPLTAAMARAGGGTLGDSISHHVDATNLSLIFITFALGASLPFVLKRIALRERWVVAVLAFLVGGSVFGIGRTDTQGLHRNALVALMGSFTRKSMEVQFTGASRPATERAFAEEGSFEGYNVLLVALESTGANRLGIYGSTTEPMPFLAELAGDGVVFEDAYAPYPESIKGLLAVLSSRLPILNLKESDFAQLSSPSLASVFAAAGYETALFHSGRFMYLGMDEIVRNAGFHVAEDAAMIGGNHNSSFGVDDSATVDRILRWTAGRAPNQPFFIHYLPISGHHPYEVASEETDLANNSKGDDESRYLNALRYSDRMLQRLVEGLAKTGALAKTLIVVYGDHGEAFGEHPGNYGHTLFLYEENVRVPLIIWADEIEPAKIHQMTSLADLAPTICDLLGLNIPSSFQGISALSGNERPALFVTDYSLQMYGLRWDEWKFIYEKESGYARLYDLSRDPHERNNLASTHDGIVRELHSYFRWSERGWIAKMDSDPKLTQR